MLADRFRQMLLSAVTLAFAAGCSSVTSSLPSNEYGPAAKVVGADSLRPPQRLAVANWIGPQYSQNVVVLNRTYNPVQTITDDINAPLGETYDSKGNLYVANSGNTVSKPGYVTEYNKSGTLAFTYSPGLYEVQSVAVDRHGNVYVPVFKYNASGLILEYPQGSNTPSASCTTASATAGVAVDGKGRIFASVQSGENDSAILEYKHGLSGCKATTLAVNPGLIGNLVVDKHENIVASDGVSLTVEIIPPPYTKVGSTITAGIADPREVALNEQQNLIYVVNVEGSTSGDIVVDTYPSGTNVTTLGASDGISYPSAVAAYR
jgi:hypothetical protein